MFPPQMQDGNSSVGVFSSIPFVSLLLLASASVSLDLPPSHPMKFMVDCITSTETDFEGWGLRKPTTNVAKGYPEALESVGTRGVMASRVTSERGKEGGVW